MNVFSALTGHAYEVPVVRITMFLSNIKEFKKDQNINEVYRVLIPYVLG